MSDQIHYDTKEGERFSMYAIKGMRGNGEGAPNGAPVLWTDSSKHHPHLMRERSRLGLFPLHNTDNYYSHHIRESVCL